MEKRKLIEVALPLEAINRESAREKSIRHGHPSTLHLWWARRPLAAARAVLFAQLVDDPSAHPEEFPTEELQRKERDRLHKLVERLVIWENVRDEKLLAEAHAEILKSTDGNPPPILDPFCGGGTIPLEAQRLGLEAHASDLNPVAVLITKALIEIPPKFRDQPPVFPGLADSEIRQWKGAEGLAADVRAYGTWILDEAEKRIGHQYPKATLPAGSKATVIAWIWARTVACPNPACRIEMPLVKSWWLCRKQGREAYVIPSIENDATQASGLRVSFAIGNNLKNLPERLDEGTVGRTGAVCVSCGTSVSLAYIRKQGRAKQIGSRLMSVVAEGDRRRIYLPPSRDHEELLIEAPQDTITGSVGYYPRDLKAPTYGLTEFTDLFTPRQLVALTTFSDLVSQARARARNNGGSQAYSDAVATYLGLVTSRCADYWSSICSWHNSREIIRNVFGRQAIPMTWDYAEAMPFSESTGSYAGQLNWVAKVIEKMPATKSAAVTQADAAGRSYSDGIVSTDPPYYDNIGYSDLSDFFYVWLRRSLRAVYPDLLSTMLVPKAEELVANPYRHNGADGAKDFFESGFRRVFGRIRQAARADLPMTVYYAFKQSEADPSGQSSTGWETLLEGMIHGGWEITSTWPLRSELANRMMASGMNALASSIVLSLRPRSDGAVTTDRRGFIAALESELPDALRSLQQGQIAPVDLPQAAIGPGMAVFSRYSAVLESDGDKMTVRSALARINETLDAVLNQQEGDFDSTSRFAIAWYRQHGYGTGKFGDADNIARALNTSVDVMDRDGVLTSRAGKVRLITPGDLSWDYDPIADSHTSNWETLHHLIKVLERDGIGPTGDFLQAALSRPDGVVDPDLVKELAHLLFRIAEGNGWTKDALGFNNLVTSWPEILDVARSESKHDSGVQSALDFEEEDN
jgi:putative DNA methylase